MAIGSVKQSTNTYMTDYSMDRGEKTENSRKNVESKETVKNTVTKDKTAEYYDYLQKNYDCVKKGNVAISGSYLKECANDPKKAKELEENLSFFKEGYESGYKSAVANAKIIGARVVNYSESWSIDKTGNVTMAASTTVTSDPGIKGWKELKEEQEERLKEKKEQERAEEKKEEQKALEEEQTEKLNQSAKEPGSVSDVYHKPFDISI